VAHVVRRFSSRSRSLKTWLGQVSPAFGQDVTGALGTFSAGLKVFGGPNDEDRTILRTRGTMQVKSNAVLASNDVTLQAALGIGLCTTEAALAGAVPLPFDNPDWDGWFVYQVMDLRPTVVGSAAEGFFGSMEVDSKAMRKIPSGQVLFLSTQLFTGSGGGGDLMNEIIQIRQLQKTS